MKKIHNATERVRFEDCEIGDYVIAGGEILFGPPEMLFNPPVWKIMTAEPVPVTPATPSPYWKFVRVYTDKSLMIGAWQRHK